MKKEMIESKDLPADENIYMKKSMGHWRVVYPINNEDGSINWKNMITGGSWLRFFAVIIIILIILGVAYEYTTNIKISEKMRGDLCYGMNKYLYCPLNSSDYKINFNLSYR